MMFQVKESAPARALPSTLVNGLLVGAAFRSSNIYAVITHIVIFAIGSICGWLFGT